MNDREKTETILKALKNKYCNANRCNVAFPELRLGSGYSDIAQRRIDLFMISSEKGNYTTSFEIKVSRGDFLKDLKDDAKQRGARLYSSNFYYVAPKGMIKPDEIPMWAGLLEYDFENKQFNKRVVAPLQSRNTPSWSLICSIVRNVNRSVYSDEIYTLRNQLKYYVNETNKMFNLLKDIKFNKYKDFPELLDMQLTRYTVGHTTLEIMLNNDKELLECQK